MRPRIPVIVVASILSLFTALATADDPATLIYTSGTTGRPKGCQLTHSNLVYETRGAKAVLPTLLRKGERLLVFLPLAHVLARALTLSAFAIANTFISSVRPPILAGLG